MLDYLFYMYLYILIKQTGLLDVEVDLNLERLIKSSQSMVKQNFP